jgi:hypothetical protein
VQGQRRKGMTLHPGPETYNLKRLTCLLPFDLCPVTL